MELFTILDRIMAPHRPVGGDVVAEALDRGWIRSFAPGQYLYGPEWTALTRTFQRSLLARAAELGFEEWLFPRLVPRTAVDDFRLTQFAPELLLSVDGGREVLDPVQCLPLYHLLAGERLDTSTLPIKIVETMGGWTWRNEQPEDLDGPIRAREFLRVEHVWMAPLEDAVRIRAQVRDGVIGFLLELGLSVQVVAGEGCMDIPAVREKLEAATSMDDVPVLDLEIPLRPPSREDGTSPDDPQPQDFEEISGCTVEGLHHLRDFRITGDMPDLASGCCGVGLNRLVVGFLHQHGFDRGGWPVDVPAPAGARV
jgi:seryl-tRNA synthetase